ncbi:helix-turn-helix domain-containing protein [Persicitalea jodogahamensis]|uniref:HTH cro/C1-type domain-containing protein n=1 Tax=Persicitalea jodogahamensis TaxID=402147 RepID=A0A8J3D5E5_9BACT|nr:helix-turn-helix transcriptional regulator [Persicitalea jodogahamensis]GHB55697.1 hypothetical protein GCM10007390_06150 [Persicitalea jodogahamensis]
MKNKDKATTALQVGTKLMKARIAKNLSRREVSDEIGVPETTYAGWENDVSYPKLPYLVPLAKILQINVLGLIDPEWRITIIEPSSIDDEKPITLLDENARNVYLKMIESQRWYCRYLENENRDLTMENSRLEKELTLSKSNINPIS